MMEKVKQVNDLLLKGEPGNVSYDQYGGYTGYKPQAIIDAMNEVFGLGGWGFKELASEMIPGKDGPYGLAIAHVEVWLKDIEFHPSGYGQSRVTKGDVGDAKKGAQTDAIKKALSYFSIGNRAYHGLLEKPDEKGKAGNGTQYAQRPTGNNGTGAKYPNTSQPTTNNKSEQATQHPTNGATQTVTPNETLAAQKSKNVDLSTVPTVSQLTEEIKTLHIVSTTGVVWDITDVIKYLFKSKGQKVIDRMLAKVSELAPEECQHIADFLAQWKQRNAKNGATSGK